MHELVGIAKKEGCKGAIVDNDKTICDGNFGKSIGYGFWERGFKKGNVNSILEGLYGVMKIKMSAFKNGEEEDVRSQKLLFHSLGKTGCADRGSAYCYAEKHRERKELEGIGNFIHDFQEVVGPVFVVTQGSSIAADVVKKAYNLAGRAANPVVYLTENEKRVTDFPFAYKYSIANPVLNEDSIIADCESIFNNAKEKKDGAQELIAGHGLDLGEMLCIGDKYSIDSATMNASLLSAPSPLADKKTKEEAKYKNLTSYAG
jgi:hypothetical protein